MVEMKSFLSLLMWLVLNLHIQMKNAAIWLLFIKILYPLNNNNKDSFYTKKNDNSIFCFSPIVWNMFQINRWKKLTKPILCIKYVGKFSKRNVFMYSIYIYYTLIMYSHNEVIDCIDLVCIHFVAELYSSTLCPIQRSA